MTWLVAALAVFLGAALLCLLLRAAPRVSTALGVGGAVGGALLGLVPVVGVLAGGPVEVLERPWEVPLGALALRLDPLAALFLLPILLLVAVCAVYAAEYFQAWRGQRDLGLPWCFWNLLGASMVLVVLSANAVLFLCAWELMSISSYFLVTFQDQEPSVRRAGWIYLVATHAGTACLLAMFLLLGQGAPRLDFAAFPAGTGAAGAAFLLGLVGFGTKAGLVPLHVWLPEAHPAAPSPVSALMSGVMIKTGLYGLLRLLWLLGPPAPWWGWTLIGVGAVSAVGGVALAVAQGDLKRLLACSSVENMGIATLGLGLFVLGLAEGRPELAALGLAGALLHLLHHALAKSALFLGAGAVLHATGTRELERLGGLLRSMPWTGTAWAVAAAAIVGLPPAGGLTGELLLLLGALEGGAREGARLAVPLLVVLLALALTSGLAAAAFVRAFGVVFLGAPRDPGITAHEAPPALRWPVVGLAGLALLAGPGAPWLLAGAVAPVLRSYPGLDLGPGLARAATIAGWVAAGAVLLLGLALIAALLRRALLGGREVREEVTWDCGYAAPTARMQYSGSSFAQPLTRMLGGLVRLRREERLAGRAVYPAQPGALATRTADPLQEGVYEPLFALVRAGALRLRWLQHGRLQLYVLSLALTLVALLLVVV